MDFSDLGGDVGVLSALMAIVLNIDMSAIQNVMALGAVEADTPYYSHPPN